MLLLGWVPGIKVEPICGHTLRPTAICLPNLPFLPSPIPMKSPSPRYFERLAKVASGGSQCSLSGTATAGVGCHLLSGPGCWWHCPPFTKQPSPPAVPWASPHENTSACVKVSSPQPGLSAKMRWLVTSPTLYLIHHRGPQTLLCVPSVLQIPSSVWLKIFFRGIQK